MSRSAARALETSLGQSQATTSSLSRATPWAHCGRSAGATGIQVRLYGGSALELIFVEMLEHVVARVVLRRRKFSALKFLL